MFSIEENKLLSKVNFNGLNSFAEVIIETDIPCDPLYHCESGCDITLRRFFETCFGKKNCIQSCGYCCDEGTSLIFCTNIFRVIQMYTREI